MSRHVKSRSGCKLCKVKRLKCDETTPSCLNCTKRGLSCPGYRQTLKWSTKHEADSRQWSDSANIPQFSQLALEAAQSVQSKNSAIGRRITTKNNNMPRLLAVNQSTTDTQERPPNAVLVTSSQCRSHEINLRHTASRITTYFTHKLANEPLRRLEYRTEKRTAGVNDFALEFWRPGQLMSPERQLSIPGVSLVELWFKSVCGMWAAFDSPSNPFRQLCSSLWASHEPLFFSLQTMAAASLPKRTPNIVEIISLAPQLSNQALISELQSLFSDPGSVKSVPAGLLAALFCMSSSLNWIDSRQLGIQYLRNARSVIELVDIQAAYLSQNDKDLLEFFRGCLIYEEMLRSIVTDDDEDVRALLNWDAPIGALTSMRLHPWAGVPITLIGLFGKVMVLCRRSRRLWRRTSQPTYHFLYQSIKDIEDGKALEEMLVSLKIPLARDQLARPDQSGDKDVEAHLYMAAEAFRLTSLLQLYQTFPDLASLHQRTLPKGDENVDREQWLIFYALHIVGLLSKIPPISPMRCLQPLICLCVGSALKANGVSVHVRQRDIMILQNGVIQGDIQPSGGLSESPSSVEMARATIQERLSTLEKCLPPGPIIVTKKLLTTVWSTYDEMGDSREIHWLDIMKDNDVINVFG